MKKRFYSIFSIVLVILLFYMTGCEANQEEESVVTPYENQLYTTLLEYFDYYYSMDLWTYKGVLEEFISTDTDLSNEYKKENSYIIGKIDLILSYNEIYLTKTYQSQESLNHKILSEDLYHAISSYTKYKREHLESLKVFVLKGYDEEINSIKADSNYEILCDKLADLNINKFIARLEQEEEEQYIESINETIELIDKLTKDISG